MSNFLIIAISFILGKYLSFNKRFPPSTSTSINLFVIYVSLPALILIRFNQLLKTISFSGNWWIPVLISWMTFFLSFILITTISRKKGWSEAKTGALILTVGLGNTSFVGFPLLEALLGKEAISVGILADQPGSFLILSTLGILIAAKYSGKEVTSRNLLMKVLTFPPTVALILCGIWTFVGSPGYEYVNLPLEKIAGTLTPLALFAVGFQTKFNLKVIARRKFPLLIGLILKLFFIPFIFYLIFSKLLNYRDFITHVALLESAMATQITSAVVAREYNLDSELANLMVGLSIPISLISVPLYNYFLQSHL